MAGSVVEQLTVAARRLPPRLADAARYIAAHPFDAVSTPMRALARQTGHSPSTFTRLAQGLGHAGWDELRAVLIDQTRRERSAAPFSEWPLSASVPETIARAMVTADAKALAAIDTAALGVAAALIEQAPRIFVAGFRSCHAPAHLFYYLYRLFRPEVSLLGAAGGVLDLEVGGLRRDDVMMLICFDPYSRDLLLTARAARAAGCAIIAVADRESAPIVEEATQVLLFSTISPGFFPSLTACNALLQALAALLYARAGQEGRAQLKHTEARIEAHTAYIPSERS
jgi:DNA-binding MurR/RpiR family transcriptional regulator